MQQLRLTNNTFVPDIMDKLSQHKWRQQIMSVFMQRILMCALVFFVGAAEDHQSEHIHHATSNKYTKTTHAAPAVSSVSYLLTGMSRFFPSGTTCHIRSPIVSIWCKSITNHCNVSANGESVSQPGITHNSCFLRCHPSRVWERCGLSISLDAANRQTIRSPLHGHRWTYLSSLSCCQFPHKHRSPLSHTTCNMLPLYASKLQTPSSAPAVVIFLCIRCCFFPFFYVNVLYASRYSSFNKLRNNTNGLRNSMVSPKNMSVSGCRGFWV